MLIAQLRHLYENKHYDEAWAVYQEGKNNDAEWHLHGSLTAWKRGEIVTAIHIIESVLRNETATDEISVKCHFQYGDMKRRMEDFTVAANEFNVCLRALEEFPQLKPLLYGPSLYNLALCQSCMGYHDNALAFYHMALAEFRRESMRMYECMCLQNMAWTLIDMERFDEAHEHMYEAKNVNELSHQNDALLAYFKYKTGDYVAAAITCEDVHRRHVDTADVPLDVYAIVCMVDAEIAFAQGMILEALSMAHTALEVSTQQTGDRRCFRLADATYRKIRNTQREVAGG